MKYGFCFFSLLFVLACTKQEKPEIVGDSIEMCVTLEKDDAHYEDGTRVTFGIDSTLIWEGNESVGVIFAKSTTGTYKYTQELKTKPGCPGIFSGKVNLGEFSTSDIIGIVYPYNEYSWGRYKSTKRIVMQVGTHDQIQKENGNLTGDNIALFAPVTISDFTVQDGCYVLAGRKLHWGCALFKFNIYGKNKKAVDGEKIESVEAYATTTKCQAGTAEWSVSNNAFAFVGETSHPHIWASLTTPCPVGETASDAVSIFASCLPRGDDGSTKVKFTNLFVFTDKAVYEKVISKDVLLKSGVVKQIDLNLSTFERTDRYMKTSGYDSVMFFGYEPLKSKPVKLYYNIPTSFTKSSMPVLFAMHGNGRTARSHLGYVNNASNSKGFIAIAPHFTETLFNSRQYHLGNVSSESDSYVPIDNEQWTYNIIEAAFDFVKEQTGNTSGKYDIWGHSAGGQFVHRFLLNMPEARVNRGIASNAGYYTVPDPKGIKSNDVTYGFPYSILDMSLPNSQLQKYFALNMTVHLGTADTATTTKEDPDLPTSAGAKAQGASRFERGQFFYTRAARVADSLGFAFNWKVEKVSGVGHSASKMAQNSTNGALVLLYGK